MSPAWIRVRVNADGSKTYQVLYRRGGRHFKPRSAGSFRGWPSGRSGATPKRSITVAEREARRRRDLVGGWLADGRDPSLELRKLSAPAERLTVRQWGDRWLRSRLDLADASIASYRPALARLYAALGGRFPDEVEPADIQDLVADLADGLAASTIETYHSTWRQVFDYARVTPNPARDRSIRLPAVEREEPNPPTADHVLRIFERISGRLLLPFVLVEQTGLRVSEPGGIEWRDVDVAGNRIRLRADIVKGRRGRRKTRWVQVPGWLMALIDGTCAPEDRAPERRVFPGFTDFAARRAMTAACKAARIPHYTPHDLRHRRITIWHHDGVPPKVISDRVGHARVSQHQETYSHVAYPGELPEEVLRGLLVRTW